MSVRLRKWTNSEGKQQERWMIDVKVKDPSSGKVIRVRDFTPVNTKRGAEQYERQIRQQILDGTFGKEQHEAAESAPIPTLAGFAERFLKVSTINNKHSSVVAKRQLLEHHLLPAFGRTRLDQIQFAQIEDFKAEMKTKQNAQGQVLSNKTINNALTVLRKLLSIAAEQGILSHVPRVKWLKVARSAFDFLSFEEAERLIAATEPEWRPLLIVALKSGLRLGELFGLQWADVDFTAGQLHVRRNIWRGVINETPKGGRSRRVDLPPSAIHALRDHRHLRGPFVFCQEDGQPLTPSLARRLLERTLSRAGITREVGCIGWHDLRHTYASHLVMRGTPLKVVQEQMGHAKIEETMRYSHLSPEAKREAVQCLDLPAPAPATPEGHKRGTKS